MVRQPKHREISRQLRADIAGKQADAFICANDYTAAVLMSSLESVGLQVPRDVRVVGFDDVKYTTLLSVPLTTIHQSCRDIAVIAFHAMLPAHRRTCAPGAQSGAHAHAGGARIVRCLSPPESKGLKFLARRRPGFHVGGKAVLDSSRMRSMARLSPGHSSPREGVFANDNHLPAPHGTPTATSH